MKKKQSQPKKNLGIPGWAYVLTIGVACVVGSDLASESKEKGQRTFQMGMILAGAGLGVWKDKSKADFQISEKSPYEPPNSENP